MTADGASAMLAGDPQCTLGQVVLTYMSGTFSAGLEHAHRVLGFAFQSGNVSGTGSEMLSCKPG